MTAARMTSAVRFWYEEVEHMQPTGRWHERRLESVRLPWLKQGPEDVGGSAEIKIAPDADELLEVAKYGNNVRCQLVPFSPRVEEGLPWHRSPYVAGNYRVELLVVADNAKPIRQVVSFSIDQMSALYAASTLEAPGAGAHLDGATDLTG